MCHCPLLSAPLPFFSFFFGTVSHLLPSYLTGRLNFRESDADARSTYLGQLFAFVRVAYGNRNIVLINSHAVVWLLCRGAKTNAGAVCPLLTPTLHPPCNSAKCSCPSGAWCVVRGAWCVVRGTWCLQPDAIPDSRLQADPVARGAQGDREARGLPRGARTGTGRAGRSEPRQGPNFDIVSRHLTRVSRLNFPGSTPPATRRVLCDVLYRAPMRIGYADWRLQPGGMPDSRLLAWGLMHGSRSCPPCSTRQRKRQRRSVRPRPRRRRPSRGSSRYNDFDISDLRFFASFHQL